MCQTLPCLRVSLTHCVCAAASRLALVTPLAASAVLASPAGAVAPVVNREKYEYMPALEQSDFGKARGFTGRWSRRALLTQGVVP